MGFSCEYPPTAARHTFCTFHMRRRCAGLWSSSAHGPSHTAIIKPTYCPCLLHVPVFIRLLRDETVALDTTLKNFLNLNARSSRQNAVSSALTGLAVGEFGFGASGSGSVGPRLLLRGSFSGGHRGPHGSGSGQTHAFLWASQRRAAGQTKQWSLQEKHQRR